MTRRHLPPGYPGAVHRPQRPQEPPPGGWRLPGPAAVAGALLRRYAVRVLLSTTHVLRRTADRLTRLRWRLEDHGTTRHRADGTTPTVPAGIAAGRADLQFTYRPNLEPRTGRNHEEP